MQKHHPGNKNTRLLGGTRFELKKLIPPKADGTFDTSFEITLTFDNFYLNEDDNGSETIRPYPILDFYDYRISGDISADGSGTLRYENQRIVGNLRRIEFLFVKSITTIL